MERNHIHGAFPLSVCRHGLEQSLSVGSVAVANLDDVVGNTVTENAHGRGCAAGVARAGHILRCQQFDGFLLCVGLAVAEGNVVQHPDAAVPHILQLRVSVSAAVLQGAVLTDGNIPLSRTVGNIDPVVTVVDNIAVARATVGCAAGQDGINRGNTGICLPEEAGHGVPFRNLVCRNGLGRIPGNQCLAVCLHDALADNIAVVQCPLREVIACVLIPVTATALARRVDFIHAGEGGSQLFVDLLQRSVLLQQVQAEALNHILVIVSDRTRHIDFVLMHGRHTHQMLRVSVLAPELHRHGAQEGAQRINTQLGKVKDTVRIGADVETGIQFQIFGCLAVLSDRNVVVCAGIGIHVILQVGGGGNLVPAVCEARLKEHMA